MKVAMSSLFHTDQQMPDLRDSFISRRQRRELEEKEKIHLMILGNGFDISHGLKTRYSDFLNWLGNQISLGNCDEFLVGTESKKDRSRSNLSRKLEYANFYQIDFGREKIALHQTLLDFLKMSNKYWFDIEKYYYLKLLKIDTEENVKVLNSFFELFRVLLEEYISKFNGTSASIKDYKLLFNKLSIDYKRLVIVNFNYTDIAENYQNGKIKIINIHGKAKDEANPIVFGYGDEYGKNFYDLEEKDSDEHLKYFKTNLYHFSSSLEQLQRELLHDFDVSIIGHSCGLSDRTLLRSIVTSDSCFRIYLYHHNGRESFRENVLRLYRHFPDKQMAREKIAPFSDDLRIPQKSTP